MSNSAETPRRVHTYGLLRDHQGPSRVHQKSTRESRRRSSVKCPSWVHQCGLLHFYSHTTSTMLSNISGHHEKMVVPSQRAYHNCDNTSVLHSVDLGNHTLESLKHFVITHKERSSHETDEL